MSRYRSYIICTSPRSGSTLLCKLLAATGVAGNPGSHFHAPSLDAWSEKYGLSRDGFSKETDLIKAIFDAAISYGTGDEGLFGLRLQRHSFDFFMEKLAQLCSGTGSDYQRLKQTFGETKLIYLTRENKLDQAISYLIARQSGLWHRASDGTELERQADPQPLIYNANEIDAQIADFERYDREWRELFEACSRPPLRITYDALSSAPSDTLARVLSALKLDPTLAASVATPTAKLANETNRHWAARYRADRPSFRPFAQHGDVETSLDPRYGLIE